MKIKADWLGFLHALRTREFERIFQGCPPHLFEHALEIGAGDGFQSSLLIRHTKKLLCTEYDESKLVRQDHPDISYEICDAEQLDSYFKPRSFDLIFSSNLLEHLEHPERAFRSCHTLLTDDGVMIHVMPGPFVKFCWLALFYPNQFVTLIEELTKKKGTSTVLEAAKGEAEALKNLRPDLGNNPKQGGKSWLRSQLWPQPHGAYPSHFQEFRGFRPKRWKGELEKAGFELVSMIRLPVTSGYGFGFNRLRTLFEKLGFSYGYAYVAVKKGVKTEKTQPFTENPHRI